MTSLIAEVLYVKLCGYKRWAWREQPARCFVGLRYNSKLRIN